MNNVVSIGTVFGIVILSVISAFTVGGLIMGLSVSSLGQDDKLYIYISFFLGQGIILVPPIYYLTIKKKPILNSLRINLVSIDTLQYSFILSLGVLIIFDTLDRIIHQIIPTPEYIIDLSQIMQPETTIGYIFLFLAVVIVAPIGEEVVFRGFLQKFLEEHWEDATRAVLVTSLFFAMIHFNPFWTIQIYLLGVVLGFLSWKTKSVIPSIILHSMNNGTAFILTVYNEINLNIYLWNENVSPVFILLGIYFIYKGIEGLNMDGNK
tara:strand:+ start:435 stop:1229 length:795 start_codon:yes stop_codon:yes gene_type:complete